MSTPSPDPREPFDDAIWPIRKWLQFCSARGLPWWVACSGVEAGLVGVGVALFLAMVLIVP